MKILKNGCVIFIVLFTYSCKNHQNKLEEFYGMWRLDKYEEYDSLSNEWKTDTTRIGYSGFILYDGKGHMGVHLLLLNGYRDFTPNENLDSLNSGHLKQLIKFYQSNFVYFGDYEISGKTILHKRRTATNPKNWGTTIKRDYEFRKDTLLLIPHERIGGKKLRLKWIKQD